jgi:Ecdysteroid kinase-like family
VLEDLAFSGYKMGSRMVGVDMAHSQLVMQKLAKFHATSVVYNNGQTNQYGEMFNTGVYDSASKQMDEYYQLLLPAFVEAVERLPQGEKYAEKVVSHKELSVA